MRFSEIQKKEVIDGEKGSFLGYVQDATVDVEKGVIEKLHVSSGEKGLFFDTKKSELKKFEYAIFLSLEKILFLSMKKRKKNDFN